MAGEERVVAFLVTLSHASVRWALQLLVYDARVPAAHLVVTGEGPPVSWMLDHLRGSAL